MCRVFAFLSDSDEPPGLWTTAVGSVLLRGPVSLPEFFKNLKGVSRNSKLISRQHLHGIINKLPHILQFMKSEFTLLSTRVFLSESFQIQIFLKRKAT